MSRSNYDKPFYVDVGTSIVAVRCASNHDVILRYDHSLHPSVIKFARDACDRMNKEAEIGKPIRNCDVGTAEEQAERQSRFCDMNTKNLVSPRLILQAFSRAYVRAAERTAK